MQERALLRGRPPFTRSLFLYLSAFLLPGALFLAICAVNGVYPFGARTLLVSDMYNQHAFFLDYSRRMFAEGNDLFYSFSKGLGGNMLNLAASYTLSPLNLLLFLFPSSGLLGAVTCILTVKIGLCGLTAYALLRAMDDRGPVTLAFSTAYALMGYVMHYVMHTMWLDAIILLPLIAWGLVRIVRERRFGLYLAALAAALFTCYYTGYMLCLFSVLFFGYLCLVDMPAQGRWAWLWPRALRFTGASLAAGGLMGFVLLPTLLAAAQTKATIDPQLLSFTEMFPLSLLTDLFVTGANTFEEGIARLPNAFTGVWMIAMGALFFANRRIGLREKCFSGALLAVLLISFHVQMFDMAWHAFNPPIHFPFRYAFVFSFVIIWLAWRSFTHAEGIAVKHALLLAPLFALYFLSATAAPLGWRYFDVLLMCVCCALLCVVLRGKGRRVALIALTALQLGHALLNGALVMQAHQAGAPIDAAGFHAAQREGGDIVRRIQAADGDFYRVVVSPSIANDPMRFSYNGITHFSSTHAVEEIEFLSALGLPNNRVTTVGYSTQLSDALDSLLGVRYLATTADASHKRYLEAFEAGEWTVYENPCALPLGFAASAAVLDADLSGDPFAVLDAVYAAILGDDARPIFVPLDSHAEPALANATASPSPQHEGGTLYAASADDLAYISFSAEAQLDDGPVFCLMLQSGWDERAEMFSEGRSLGGFASINRLDVFSLGDFWAGDAAELTMLLTDGPVDLQEVAFFQEDVDAFEEKAARIAEHGASLRKITSSRLAGEVTIPEERPYLLFTIPYDAGWRAHVGGRTLRPVRAAGALLAFAMEPGEHAFELRYVPPGFAAGCALTAATLLALAGYALILRIMKMRKTKERVVI
ncbi:MAG: YfhO family protein [Clostridia bacterium]|nr:YfhO family protein [Clostridia bacterium]